MENVTNNQDNTNIAKPKTKIWRVVKYTLLILLSIFIIAVFLRSVQMYGERNDAEKVKEIHSIRLSMKDVEESNLPPVPNKEINDSTVSGIDANNNYVRDDVELFIFDKYKTREERAAWLQYARAMSFVMTKADSKETLKAVMEEGSRSGACLVDIYRKSISFNEYSKLEKEMYDMIFNNKMREDAKEFGYSNMTSSGPGAKPNCDLNE